MTQKSVKLLELATMATVNAQDLKTWETCSKGTCALLHHILFFSGDVVTLEVIVGRPATIDWCYRYALRVLQGEHTPETTDAEHEQWAFFDGYMLDDSDDSYTVIDGPSYDYHDHPDALCVFAPRFPIPPEVEQKLHNYYATTIKQDS